MKHAALPLLGSATAFALVALACSGSSGSGGSGGTASTTGTGNGTGTGTGSTSSGVGGGIMGAPPGAPVIFYTDLASAPANAYVTLWGKNFGTTQGASTVTLGGAPVGKIVSWSDGEIELQLSASPQAGDLVVGTAKGMSPGVPLGVHTGKLYFVSPSGSDAYSGTLESASGGDGPFATLTKGRDALAPGDVLYVRAGQYTALDNFNAVLSLYVVPPGSADHPVAIVGYPGEKAILGDGSLARTFSLYTGDTGPALDYLVIAKLVMKPSCDGIELINGAHGRFVGNEISGAHDACSNGVVEAQGTSSWKIFGNFIHDNGNTKLEHGIYLGGYGTQTDWEIAWNRIENQSGGRAIQLFGHQPMDTISSISIHDNEITDIDRDGIVLGDTDADVLHLSDVRIYDNIFHRAGRCVGSGVRVGNATATGISIVHNTFVDNGAGNVACDQSPGQPQGQLLMELGAMVEASNNIFHSLGTEKYVDEQTAAGVLSGSNNLYFGGGTPPAWDTAPQSGDPLWVNLAQSDFHLSPGSPAIDHAAPSSVTVDHDGVKRPVGSLPDIGAYEWSAP